MPDIFPAAMSIPAVTISSPATPAFSNSPANTPGDATAYADLSETEAEDLYKVLNLSPDVSIIHYFTITQPTITLKECSDPIIISS
jgi:hypothetical protein